MVPRRWYQLACEREDRTRAERSHRRRHRRPCRHGEPLCVDVPRRATLYFIHKAGWSAFTGALDGTARQKLQRDIRCSSETRLETRRAS